MSWDGVLPDESAAYALVLAGLGLVSLFRRR
ncbi:MYXO-CTERM sorting domain-containing protein [Massilia polaris]|nr:MYXO-CTERM sorting domain-containing protein [Massilia polaris]